MLLLCHNHEFGFRCVSRKALAAGSATLPAASALRLTRKSSRDNALVRFTLLGLALLAIVGCDDGKRPPGKPPARGNGPVAVATPSTLAQARSEFETKYHSTAPVGEADPAPPPKLFSLVRYDSDVGQLAAYLTPDPKDGKKRPAIVWITGGDCNTIGDVWKDAPASNDQTASAFRKQGIVMMFPSLRGGNDNPGKGEAFYGEVDDVIAAAEFLSQQPHVDPNRIYLGGHSSGGTMVLLVAECTNRFRAIFSFGPVGNPAGYGPELFPADEMPSDEELELRAPIRWLHSIQSRTFVIEGAGGNIRALNQLEQASTNPAVQFLPVEGADHFNILAPATKLIASKILADTGMTTNLEITEEELAALFAK
jgi:acetyl esterase/lipase